MIVVTFGALGSVFFKAFVLAAIRTVRGMRVLPKTRK